MSYRKNIVKFTLGTDSEYCMLDSKNNIVRAADYVDINDKFGRDGWGDIWEIKSLPSECPLKIVQSIRKIMQDAVNNNPVFTQFRWVTGSSIKDLPLASHIHVGIAKNIINPHDLATQFLDHFLGAISILLEDRKQGLARRARNKSPGGNKCEYGRLGDVRIKRHNQLSHWEYRVCSSCLEPNILTAMLCLSKVVIHEVLHNSSFAPRIYIEKGDEIGMNQEKIRTQFNNIWSNICSMILFPVYRKQLQIIPYLVNKKLTWNPNNDLKVTWGIIDNTKFSNRLSLHSIWAKYKNDDNLDIIGDLGEFEID